MKKPLTKKQILELIKQEVSKSERIIFKQLNQEHKKIIEIQTKLNMGFKKKKLNVKNHQ